MSPADRDDALFNFYRLQRRAGFCPIEANEAMGEFAKRLDKLEQDKRTADDQFSRDLDVIRKCMEAK